MYTDIHYSTVHVGCLLWTAFMSDTSVYIHYAGDVSEFGMAWLSCFHFIYIRYYLLDTSQTLQKCLAHKTIVEYPTLHVVLSEKASSYQHVGSSQTQQGIETVVFVWEIRLNIYIQWQVTIHKCDEVCFCILLTLSLPCFSVQNRNIAKTWSLFSNDVNTTIRKYSSRAVTHFTAQISI